MLTQSSMTSQIGTWNPLELRIKWQPGFGADYGQKHFPVVERNCIEAERDRVPGQITTPTLAHIGQANT